MTPTDREDPSAYVIAYAAAVSHRRQQFDRLTAELDLIDAIRTHPLPDVPVVTSC